MKRKGFLFAGVVLALSAVSDRKRTSVLRREGLAMFGPRVVPTVSAAVADAAVRTGVARKTGRK